MMNCKQATDLVSQKLDRHLSLAQRIALRFHLLMCHYCRNYSKQLNFLRRATGHMGKHIEDLEHELPAKSREKLKQAIKDNQ